MFENDRNENAPSTGSRTSKRRATIAWFWVVCWAGLIWILGSDEFSFSETSDSFLPWLDWLTGDLDWRTRYQIYIAIRKSAHFIEYAILGLLSFRAALSVATGTRLATARWLALLIVTVLATADETRQAYSPVRTGSPYDIMIDIAGGALAILGFIIIARRMRPPEQKESSA